eukprot:CAMPEP_0194599632 /NCGR_PEP_ID=MMETSP0292-20121207/27795_1 /TAXON_ID=39354 /ORGANISM="Heterosigma akashiwo, Strain CCMP2393" /LENGTH=42 /DNA_ID= /DNA_START= /DNA_END= /DNA_ORIENTATION=
MSPMPDASAFITAVWLSLSGMSERAPALRSSFTTALRPFSAA